MERKPPFLLAQPAGFLRSLPRNEFLAGLCVIGCVNGLGAQIIETVRLFGWADAALMTFGTSAMVWIACCAAIWLLFQPDSEYVRPLDVLVGAASLVLIAFPIGGLSWLALSVLSLYLICFSIPLSPLRRGAIILFAATVPMLWSRLLFRLFGEAILNVDAWFVGLLLGTGNNDNMVPFVDGSGTLVILPYCSSLANVSLAFLAWALISRWQPRRFSTWDIVCCAVAAAMVVSVNVTRIGLMGLSQHYYSAIHSQSGEVLANLLILGLTLSICLIGAKHEIKISS